MTAETDAPEIPAPAPPGRLPIRGALYWSIQSARLIGVGWALWGCVYFAFYWSDRAFVVESAARYFSADISGMALWQHAAGVAAMGVGFALSLAAIRFGLALLGLYLAGEVFSPLASVLLRRAALFGLAARLLEFPTRPLSGWLFSLHLPPEKQIHFWLIRPDDLVILMLLASLAAIASVQKAAAEMAQDHAQIV